MTKTITADTRLYTMSDLHAALVKHPHWWPREIAELVGCSPGAVRQYARRHGLPHKKVEGKAPGGRKAGVPNGQPREAAKRPYVPKPQPETKARVSATVIKPGMTGSGRVSYTPLRFKD